MRLEAGPTEICHRVSYYVGLGMTEEVVVTRKGQTTIPVTLRKKYGIQEGTRLELLDMGEGVLLKRKVSFLDLAGSGAKKATVKEIKDLLDRLRREDV